MTLFSADTPDRPRNVKAIPVSATEVNVTWSPAATREGFEVMAYGVDFHEVHGKYCRKSPGPKVIKLFSFSTQLSLKFILLINVKMPTLLAF